MLMLACINLCFILLINEIRIQDILIAWENSKFHRVIYNIMFLLALDFLSVIALLFYNKSFSKYIYPIILLLYVSYLSYFNIKYHRGNDLGNGLDSEKYSAYSNALPTGDNIAFINVSLPDLGIKGVVKLNIKTNNFDKHVMTKNIYASWISPSKYILYSPILFFNNYKLASGAMFKIEHVSAIVSGIEKSDKYKIRFDCSLEITYSAKIDYLNGNIYRSKTINTKNQKIEIDITPEK